MALRTRFGVEAPRPLSELPAGALAMSELALLRPEGIAASPDPEHALAAMYASTMLQNPSKVAVYWESYGVRPGDTVDVTLRIEPDASLLRRALSVTGLVSSDRGVAVGWRSPDPAHDVFVIPGRVAAFGQTMVLDLSLLAAGSYRVSINVGRPNQGMVSSSREFTVAR